MTRKRIGLAIGAGLALVLGSLGVVYQITKPTREALQTYVNLIGAANRGDAEAARSLCTVRYRKSHKLETPQGGGGLVGLPRNLHQRFQVWRQDGVVYLCPTNRIGPLYRFRFEDESWRFDGPVGILRADGQVDVYEENDPQAS